MSTQLIPVPFRDTTLLIIDHEGQPFVPMKPVVEGMGLAWQTQHRKLVNNKSRWGITITVIPSESGPQDTCCLPLRKLPGWLMTIHANKVRNELRSTIIAYQNECDEVLWRHWTEHQTPAPMVATPPTSGLDWAMQQYAVLGLAMQELQAQQTALAKQRTALQQIDERLEVIETGYDSETRFKVQVYEELMRVDPTSGVRVWRLRMRERMRRIGMTQTRLAVMLGLSQSSVNHYIHDNRRPSLETLERIALSLGLTLAELLSPRRWPR